MANEAVIITLLGNGGDPVRYTCASGTAIVKGTIMKLVDPLTTSASTGNGDFVCGIAAADKSATDNATTIAVYTNGIFDLYSSGAVCTAGCGVSTSGANVIRGSTQADSASGAKVFGIAQEDSIAATNEMIAVKLYL